MKHLRWLGAMVAALHVTVASSFVPPEGLPFPCADASAVDLNGTVYVFMQNEVCGMPVSTGEWVCDYVEYGVSAAGAAVVGNSVFVVGGGGQEPVNNCTVLTNWQFSTCTPMPTPRGYLGVASVGGIVYAIGGFAPPGWNVVESYSPVANSWKTGLPALPTPRYGLSAAAVGGSVYAIGGTAWHIPACTTNEAYNPATNTWATKASLQIARSFASTAVLNDEIYIFGGQDYMGNNLNTVEIYNPVADVWRYGANVTNPARSHTASAGVPEGGYILLAGGSTGSGTSQIDLADVVAYTSS